VIAVVCAAIGLALAHLGLHLPRSEGTEGSAGSRTDPAEAEEDAEGAHEAGEQPEGAHEASEQPEGAHEAGAEEDGDRERQTSDRGAGDQRASEQPSGAPTRARSSDGRAGLAPAIANGLRVVRGRVAYLRCDGVPQRSGPAPCPRDEALEAAAWSVIEALPSCPELPVATGEADIVVDLAPGRANEVRTRDTFAQDVVRLDRARVVGCLAGPLAALPQQLGSSRLVVSFRFAIRSRE
jgi:hypothetical protein